VGDTEFVLAGGRAAPRARGRMIADATIDRTVLIIAHLRVPL
jgi:hypothetical protein